MSSRRWFRSKNARGQRYKPQSRARLAIEQLEDRTLLAGNVLTAASVLTLPASNVVRTSDFIESTADVDLFRIALNKRDRVTVDLNAQNNGSGLDSYLRIFDRNGVQIAANDDFEGSDSRLTFQASKTGTYYIGVSASGNTKYSPRTGKGGVAGIIRVGREPDEFTSLCGLGRRGLRGDAGDGRRRRYAVNHLPDREPRR
ncbi:MAG: PPC domain-containing protein [Planctomycetia bacterium]|nr:PPC domain-containing protein [Planctomycetia bacterium]